MMTVLFSDYLKHEKSLTLEEMDELHSKILISALYDDIALEMYDELVDKAAKYANIRAAWIGLSREQKMAADEGRTMVHNSLIVKFNQLARYVIQLGKDASWRTDLGFEEDDKMNRKRIGDMGCYIAFIQSLNAR